MRPGVRGGGAELRPPRAGLGQRQRCDAEHQSARRLAWRPACVRHPLPTDTARSLRLRTTDTALGVSWWYRPAPAPVFG
jgi:hypothetical protein